jgi:hypothetical protein
VPAPRCAVRRMLTGPVAEEGMHFIRLFRETGLGDVALVGGKNASLGEMLV